MLSDGNPMQPLSAVGAIAPAFTRVHEILFHPFRVGRSWKLAATNYCAFFGSLFVPVPLFIAPILSQSFSGVRSGMMFLLAAMTFIYLACFCLGTGLSLVSFDMIVTRGQFIAPMWRRVSGRIWPWVGIKVAAGTVVSALLAPLGFAAIRHMQVMMAMMPQATPGHPVDPAAFHTLWPAIVSSEALFLAFFFVLKAVSTLLDDFVRPFYLLEEITIVEAFRRGARFWSAEPGENTLYLLMKLVLGIAGVIMQYISYFVVILALVLVAVVIGLIGFAVVHVTGGSNSAAAKVFLLGGGILLYLVFTVVASWYAFGSFGYLIMLLGAYGVYFVGGRYPLLGRLLEPGPGAPFTPPPVFRSPDEGPPGPPFPMDPAVA